MTLELRYAECERREAQENGCDQTILDKMEKQILTLRELIKKLEAWEDQDKMWEEEDKKWKEEDNERKAEVQKWKQEDKQIFFSAMNAVNPHKKAKKKCSS